MSKEEHLQVVLPQFQELGLVREKTRRGMESAHGSSARVGDHQVPGSQGGEGSNAEVPPVFQTES